MAPSFPTIRRVGAIVLVWAVATLAGCGLVPFPGGEGSASPEPGDPPAPPALVTSPRAVAVAAISAWGRGDARGIDPIATSRAATILDRPFPEPPPSFINCSPDVVVAGATSCYFAANDLMVVVVTLPGARGEWKVISVRFRP